MARELNGFKEWPDTAVALSTPEVIELYKSGFAGAYQDPEESDSLNNWIASSGGVVDGGELTERYGFAGDGAGKLSILFPAVVKCYGLESLTKPGQQTGDCVSKMIRDLCLYTICLEALAGVPDELSGKVEAVPQVSDKARRNGVFVNEGVYLSRGHNDQGMSCSQGIRHVTTESGIVVRQKFEQADLEAYNVNFELRGRNGSPDWLNNVGRLHPLRDITRPKAKEASRDLFARGKAQGVCSGLGFSKKRDKWGHSEKSGSWSHAWHWAGYDDRPVTIQEYGEPQILAGQRWAIWNSGGRDIIDSAALVPESDRELWIKLGMVNPDTGNILIPEGYWWFDASLASRCDIYAASGASGWETNTLPDYLGGWK